MKNIILREFIRKCIQEELSNPEYDPEYIKRANLTSRSGGAIGKKAIVPRAIKQYVTNKKASILDFGAGKTADHASDLKNSGYINVTAYEFGNNFDPNLHDINALTRKYDIVYASNVLNVQSSEDMLINTLTQIKNTLKKSGIFIFNFPKSPRYDAYRDQKTPKDQLLFLLNTVSKIFRNEPTYKKIDDSKTPVYFVKKI